MVRVNKDSTEYATLKARTTGTAVITQTYDAGATYTATFAQVGFRSVAIGETDGVVTLSVEASPQWSGTAILTVAALCEVQYICAAPV